MLINGTERVVDISFELTSDAIIVNATSDLSNTTTKVGIIL